MVAQIVKCLPTLRETQVRSLGQEDPLEKAMATHSSLLPGKSHGQRNVVGYRPMCVVFVWFWNQGEGGLIE